MDEERSDIEELTYGMVTAEGKTNFDKFMRYFFVINVSILMYKKASRNTNTNTYLDQDIFQQSKAQ